MFHEIWAFWPLLNKNRFVQRLHRGEIARLIAQADSVFTSTPSQAEHLRKLVPNCNLQVMPVGSNIRARAGNRDAEGGMRGCFRTANFAHSDPAKFPTASQCHHENCYRRRAKHAGR